MTAERTMLSLHMQAQPDDRSCGPTCLHAVYRYFGLESSVRALVDDIPQLETGGTLAVQLGCDALRRGFSASVYTYNLQLFDPTWFADSPHGLAARLSEQARHKRNDSRLLAASARYQEFLALGGQVLQEPLDPDLLSRFLRRGLPILTGLSATHLYGAAREIPEDDQPDDVRGEPVGHFVVLCGYDPSAQTITLADPWPDPEARDQLHVRPLFRVLSAILLGVLTYDANLLVIEPR